MFKGIDIRYATRPTDDDRALMDLRAQLRTEHEQHQSLSYKLTFLGARLQTALDKGQTEIAIEAASLFARLKDDLTARMKAIMELNRRIAAIDPTPQPERSTAPLPDPADADALITRILKRLSALTTPNPIPS